MSRFLPLTSNCDEHEMFRNTSNSGTGRDDHQLVVIVIIQRRSSRRDPSLFEAMLENNVPLGPQAANMAEGNGSQMYRSHKPPGSPK